MKLITKIYLAFGFILLVFSFVTLTYVLESKEISEDSAYALDAAEVLRLSESMEKAAIDSETGLRGYHISGNESFLAPYFDGQEQFAASKKKILALIKNQDQVKQLEKIDSTYHSWITTYADSSINLRRKALLSEEGDSTYEVYLHNFIGKGFGKKKIDHLRSQFQQFDLKENEIKIRRINQLNESITFTNMLAVALTLVCIVIGIVTAYLLGSTIRNRLRRMIHMAESIAKGDFEVHVDDVRHDEISRLSESLNVMALKLDDYFKTLNKKNKELDQFAYVVSHDLKAPLRAINSLAEWIEEDLPQVEPEVKKNIDLLRGRVLRMENLINGILEYSRVGKKQLQPEKFEVKELLEEIVDSLSANSNITVELPDKMPAVFTEKILLQQVFGNLISNAIKYHDKPHGRVWVTYQKKENETLFAVHDDGPGIAPEFHDRIFVIFQTMEARDTRESTGVGLAIVKKIIDEKDGRIWVESEVGKGTSFYFTWPKCPKPVLQEQYILQ